MLIKPKEYDIVKWVRHLARYSECTKKKVGCVLVTDKGFDVAFGHNYNPDGDSCEINGVTVDSVIHAEEAAVQDFFDKYTTSERATQTLETAYITHRPCRKCLVELQMAGITKIVVTDTDPSMSWIDYDRFDITEAIEDPNYSHRDSNPVQSTLSATIEELLNEKDTTEISFGSIAADKAELAIDKALNDLIENREAMIKDYSAKKNQKTTDGSFMKFDSDKLRYDLVPPSATRALADILTYGAEKYEPGNWKKVDDPSRYLGAMLRHIESYRAGEIMDPESGRHHLAHAMTNIAFLIDLDYNPGEQP